MPHAADGLQDSVFGLVGLQVELMEDVIAELHHTNSHFVWPNVQLLNNSDDEIPNVSKSIRPNAIRAVNEEDDVLFITRDVCREAKRAETICVPRLCLSFSGGFLCYLLSCESPQKGLCASVC